MFRGALLTALNEVGLGSVREIERLVWFREHGFRTLAFVHTIEEAELMTTAGAADILVLHPGPGRLAPEAGASMQRLIHEIRGTFDGPVFLHAAFEEIEVELSETEVIRRAEE